MVPGMCCLVSILLSFVLDESKCAFRKNGFKSDSDQMAVKAMRSSGLEELLARGLYSVDSGEIER